MAHCMHYIYCGVKNHVAGGSGRSKAFFSVNIGANKMRKSVLYGLVALGIVWGPPGMAMPITQNIDLNTVYTGATPSGPAPWLSAEFSSETGATSGVLTLTSLLDGSDFVQGGKNANAVVGWAFYLDSGPSSVTCSGGSNCADSVFFGDEYNSGPVPGDFNLSFSWDQSDRFMGADTAIYALEFGSALAGSPFALNDSGWTSVAHIQGIAPNGCSGWIVAGSGDGASGGTPCGDGGQTIDVAEPSSVSLFAMMLAGIGLLAVARGRRSKDI